MIMCVNAHVMAKIGIIQRKSIAVILTGVMVSAPVAVIFLLIHRATIAAAGRGAGGDCQCNNG